MYRENRKFPERAEAQWKKLCKARYLIYALVDPRTNEPRYVGATHDPDNRLKAHLKHSHSVAVRKWVAELKASGLVPRFEVLAEADGYIRATFAEAEFIFNLGAKHDLLNQNGSYEVRMRNLQAQRERNAARRKRRRERQERIRRREAEKGPIKSRQRMLTVNGRTQNMAAWAKELGISREGLRQRLLRHPVDVALSPCFGASQ